jgi:hypothetical protein
MAITEQQIEAALEGFLTEQCAQRGESFSMADYKKYGNEEQFADDLACMKAALEAAEKVRVNNG